MTAPLLRVRDLRTQFGDPRHPTTVVDGLDLDLFPGETFALLGESGCGKSMTALSLMRLLPPGGRIVRGQVQLGDRDLLRIPEFAMRRVRGGRLAMIFQEPQTSLNPVLTLERQIGEAIRLHDPERFHSARVLELLEAVGIPDPKRRQRAYPHQLSGGMKQRVMIAMALAGNPELLIADEPTTALDVTIQAQVLGLLKGLQERTGLAVLLITHDLGVVGETADRLAVMYAGQILETASRAAFFARPAHPYSRKLLESLPTPRGHGQRLAVIPGRVPPLDQAFPGCRFAPRCPWAEGICRSQAPAWQSVGREHRVRCHRWADLRDPGPSIQAPAPSAPPKPESEGDPILEVRGLRVHFPIQKGLLRRTVGQVKAVDGVDLDLRAGRTLALVGESGCGKTTIGKGILQLVRPTGGRVWYRGQDLMACPPRALKRYRKELQIIFQDPFAAMNPRLLVEDILAEGLQALGSVRGRRERRARVQALLEQVGLPPQACDRYPHEFSGGQRQRICIARALAVAPRVLICDEPTSALDVSVQAQILNLLQDLQESMGLSFLLITHDLSVVAYLAHRVAVMYLGRILESGTREEILETPRHPYTRALLSAVPVLPPEKRRTIIRLAGELPSPADPPPGCHFHPRCPEARPECAQRVPPEIDLSPTHRVRCHLVA